MGDLIVAKDLSLGRVVALVERLNPPARDDLVRFWRICPAQQGWAGGRCARSRSSADGVPPCDVMFADSGAVTFSATASRAASFTGYSADLTENLFITPGRSPGKARDCGRFGPVMSGWARHAVKKPTLGDHATCRLSARGPADEFGVRQREADANVTDR